MEQGQGELVGVELLAVREVKLLAECEQVIQADIKAFMRVGQALATINNERLYRSEFLSFKEYVAAKWDMAEGSAYRFIDANVVVESIRKLLPGTSLLGSPIGELDGDIEKVLEYNDALDKLLPKNEAQARALTKFKDDPDKLLEVWTSALRTAPVGKVTAKHVEKTIHIMGCQEKGEKIKQTREKVNQEKRFSPEFKAAFNALWAEIQKEVISKFSTTSKEAIIQHARGILNILGVE